MRNETLDSILNRRSIRRFKPEQIGDEELGLILQAATYAPSGSNSQKWLFTAVQNAEALEKINELVRQAVQKWNLPEGEYPAKIGTQKAASRPEFCFYNHAPTLIIASNIRYTNSFQDCSAALQNIFLAAHSLGLGSCWINPISWVTEDDGVREYLATLGIPRDHVICGSAAIGFIDGEPPKAPARKEGTIRIIR